MTYTTCAETHIAHAQDKNGQPQPIAPHAPDKRRGIETHIGHTETHMSIGQLDFVVFIRSNKFVIMGLSRSLSP